MNYSQTIHLKQPLKINRVGEIVAIIGFLFIIISAFIFGNSTEWAVWMSVYAVVILTINKFIVSPKFKYSPRIIVETDSISCKKSYFKSAEKISLSGLKEIKLGSYSFTLIFENKPEVEVNYEGYSFESVEVKKALRELAEFKKINISY